jgi:hypothetical protein
MQICTRCGATLGRGGTSTSTGLWVALWVMLGILLVVLVFLVLMFADAGKLGG